MQSKSAQEKAEASETAQKLHEEILALEENETAAQQKLQVTLTETKGLRRECIEANRSLQESNDDAQHLSQKTDELRVQLEKICAIMAQKTEEYQRLDMSHTKLLDEVQNAEIRLKDLEVSIADSNTVLTQVAERQTDISKLRTQQDSLKADIMRCQEELHVKTMMNASLSSDVAERSAQKADLVLEVQQLEESLDRKSQKLSQLTAELVTIEARNKALTEEACTLKEFIAKEEDLGQEVEALGAQRSLLKESLTELGIALKSGKSEELALSVMRASELAKVIFDFMLPSNCSPHTAHSLQMSSVEMHVVSPCSES